MVFAALLLTFIAFAGAAQAAPNTTVTFTFDDGRPSQLAAAQQLSNRGMNATFFIISSTVGRPGVMSVSDLNALKASGMEIGAHTVYHRDLAKISSDEAMREVCLSRNWLMDRGFDIYGMANPYDSTNASVKQITAACGYNSARTGGQLICDANHACAETVPPLDAYSLRTPLALETTTTLAEMKAMVTDAQANGGGWVPLEIHDICDGPGDPLLPPFAQCLAPGYVARATFNQFLDWVKGEVDAGRVQVKTVHEVIGGSLKPQVAVDPAPVRTGNMLVNPSFEQAGTNGQPSACWNNITNGPDFPPVIASTSDAHAGSKALAVNVPAGYEGWAYNLIAPELDLAQCSPRAFAGHHYTFGGWYKGDGPIKVVAYWRNTDNQWERLNWGSDGTATFPAATPWTQASFTFQAPAGATAVSAGFYIDGASANHSYTIDDTSLVDEDAAPPVDPTLTVNAAGAGSGTVTSTPAGIACGATCAADFTDGSTVTLTAAAAAGSSFTSWSGACSGTSTTCTVAMTAAKSVTATFALLPVQLSVAKAGLGNGTVTSSPAGIVCGATCAADFTNGATVTLTAVAAAGSSFTSWSGACSGASATCALSMSAAKSVTAAFALLPVQLSVAKSGTGSGSVSSNPAGITCGATCQADFTNGATVTLTAVAAAGSSFTGWSGACSGSATCTVSLDVARSVTATFTLLPVHLSVTRSGAGGGTVTSSPAGIDCGSTCEADFTNGATVTLTAAPVAGSAFAGWSGACSGTSTCTVSLGTAKSVTAIFTLLPVQLSVTKTGAGSGSVTSSPSAISCGVTCQADFANGSSVTLTAGVIPGSAFTGWSGACSGTSTTCTVSMSAARSVTANFALLPVQLSVSKVGTGSGSVGSSPAGISCGATCQADYANGTSVTLTAVATPGSTFTGWSGACSGTSSTCTVSMTAARTATARFTDKAALAVVKAGTGNGSVSSSPGGIDCGSTCGDEYTSGATVTLTAVAAPGSTFTGWSGACSGTSATCTLSMTGDRTATATFTVKAALAVVKAGTGNGSVSGSPGGIDCGSTCEDEFTNGTTVTLTAVAAPGSTFAGWSGACSGTSATCTLSMTGDRTATATFTVKAALAVVKAGTGTGAVTSNVGGIDCGIACAASLTNGTSVTLTAVAAPGSTFTGWSGACSGTATTCTLSMTSDRTATATFTVKAALAVVNAGAGNGAVTSDVGSIDCGIACAASLTNGTSVTLTAVAAPGSTFTGWSGACSGTAPTCTLSMTDDRTATATFTVNAALAVGTAGDGTVTSNVGAIDCGTTCEDEFTNGTSVTLTAVAAPGSTFMGWSGACSGTAPTCTLTMNADRNVTATFATNPELTVRKVGSGNGWVTSSPAGINCHVMCSEQDATYAPGTTVTLTAVAAPGSTFRGWSDGSCAGAITCTFSLDAARTVTATFTADPPAPAPAPSPDAIPAAAPPVPAADIPAPVAQAPVALARSVTPAAVKVRPTVRTKPKVSGRARVGSTLTCSRGAWNGSPTGYAFTWRRDGKVVGHGSSYLVKKADRGHAIRCDVTARNAKGATTVASATVRVPR